MWNHVAPQRLYLLIHAGGLPFLWLIRLLRLLSDAINRGITAGSENYCFCLETLQRGRIICLLLAHCEHRRTHSYCMLTPGLHIYKGFTDTQRTTSWVLLQSENIVDTMFYKLWRLTITVIHLFLSRRDRFSLNLSLPVSQSFPSFTLNFFLFQSKMKNIYLYFLNLFF